MTLRVRREPDPSQRVQLPPNVTASGAPGHIYLEELRALSRRGSESRDCIVLQRTEENLWRRIVGFQ